jgi:PAS domain S-box-containing protein
MSKSCGGPEPELLVVTEDQSFGSAVVDAVAETRGVASAEQVEPATDRLTQRDTSGVDGAIVDSRIAEPVAVIERFTEKADLPVVVLSEAAGDGDTVARVIEAGATDVFPRTTASAQHELAAERLVTDSSPTKTQKGDPSYREAYEALFEKISEGLVVHEPETGVIVDVNERFCEMNGYERTELVGEPIGIVMPDNEAYGPEAATEMIQQARTEGPQQFEWHYQPRDGETFPVEVDPTVLELDGEERVLASVQDITERKRRKQEYEQIFNGVQDAIAVFDPDTLEYLDANEAYLEMFDHESVSELRERGVSGLSITEEGYTEQRGREVHQRVAKSGQPETLEWQGETSGGERVWLDVKVAPAVIGGTQRTVSIQRDITDRKRREQRLEVFNRILRHNLRNQLDVIQSHAEVLADRTTDDHAERIMTAVGELAGIGRRAREVDRILSKDETPTEIDITRALRETVERMEPTDSDVAVTTELPGEIRLLTDKETVTMAVKSALENAFEYATSAVTVAVEDGPNGCVITISDDGPGIPEEELTPIVTRTETRLQHGRGLGLWQLRWCVDSFNGELSFETETGTLVRITVPDRRGSGRPD